MEKKDKFDYKLNLNTFKRVKTLNPLIVKGFESLLFKLKMRTFFII